MTSPVQYGSVQPVQFPLTTNCIGPCWSGGSGTVTVVNQDAVNFAYIGYTNSISPGGFNTAPLPPNGTMTFPGDRSIYAVGDTTNMKPLLLMPGAIQYYAPASLAANLVMPSALTGITVAGGGTNSYGPFNISQVGYEIIFGAMKASGAGAQTNPFVIVQLVWTDAATGFELGTDSWTCPIAGAFAAGGQFPIYGRGPTKANQVTINIMSVDTVSANCSVALFQNARVYAVDDWRWNNNTLNGGGITAPTGYTLPGVPFDESILGQSGLTVAVSSSQSRLFGMYNGPCNFDYVASGPSASAQVYTLEQSPGSIYGGNKILSTTPSSFPVPFIGPRAPINVTIQNTSAATPIVCTFTTIIQPI